MMKKNHLINIIKNSRTYIALGHDFIVAVVAWLLAYSVRFNFDIPATHNHEMWLHSYWIIPLEVTAFLGFGLYKGAWRFASIPDLKRILKAVGFSALLVVTVCLILKPFGTIPRSILLLNPILLVVGICGSRIAYRISKEQALYGKIFTQGKPVIILGAGEAAINLVKELSRSKDWQVVGLVDDDKTILGRQLAGARVLGTLEDLPEIAQKYQVSHAIVAMPSVDHSKRRTAVDNANACGLTVLTVPAFDDLMSGKVSISQIRKVQVEDLLGREPVQLDTLGLHDLIENNAILITGAGGSIGSELCRQILKYHPSQLICVDTSELSLYQIEQEFSQLNLPESIEIKYATANVRNEKRIKALLTTYQPTVVYHAAAYKHVPLMENMNVAEALSNNVLGTYTVAKACNDAAVSKFVLISTDKAVNPTNVMGASKRLAEMVCQGLQGEGGTKFVTVRFGNVLGSSGSVIPKFREQIANGGPVTITHPEITRYFMSIPEAAQLVMQAGMMGSGGEIFVLDMGESVKIVNLAKDMIRLSGLSEDEVDIVYTGLRPGEKLYEELLADDEHTLSTPHDKLRIAEARTADFAWVQELLAWIESIHDEDEQVIKAGLKTWVEEYEIDVATSKHASRTAETVTVH
jgi:FlaA1/EpsC-like NDP-sugar epimerase